MSVIITNSNKLMLANEINWGDQAISVLEFN